MGAKDTPPEAQDNLGCCGTLFSAAYFDDTSWPCTAQVLEKIQTCKSQAQLRDALLPTTSSSNTHITPLAQTTKLLSVTRNGNPDYQPVLDDIAAANIGEFSSLFTETLPHIADLAHEAPRVLRRRLDATGVCTERRLLTPAYDDVEAVSSASMSRHEAAILLAMAFLGILPASHDSDWRASMAPLLWPKQGCDFAPNVEKLKCFLHYFNQTWKQIRITIRYTRGLDG